MRLGLMSLLVVVVLGCGDDDPIKPRLPTPIYPSRTTPENAVVYYKIAWERRDSVAIDSVLADDYLGTSNDMTDPGSGVLDFVKSDEISVLHGLQQDQKVVGVSVDLGSPSLWTRLTGVSDPPGWVTFSLPDVRVVVDRTDESFIAEGMSTMFKVKPIPMGGTDTSWVVVRWHEIQASP